MKKYKIDLEQGMKALCSLPTSPLKMYRFKVSDMVGRNDDWHFHPQGHEYYLVLNGHMILKLEHKVIEVKTGEMIQVEPGEKHEVIDIKKSSDILVIRQEFTKDDKVIVPR